MLDEAKNNIAKLIFNKKFLKGKYNSQLFNKFLTESDRYLFIMPNNDSDFKNSFDVIRYFLIYKKKVSLFLPEFKINLIPDGRKYSFIGFGLDDITNLNLPSKSLIQRLNEYSFDVVVDLNRSENLFFIAVANIVRAKNRIGFKRTKTDPHYNFLMVDDKINSEKSYRNLLNSLKMF